MKFLVCLSTLIAVAITLAKPVVKRQIGGILICNGAEATGNCSYQVYELNTCYNMTSPFFSNAATFAPDGEDFYCYPYLVACGGICTSPQGCTAGAISYNSTDKFNLTALSGWDQLISSFECHAGVASSMASRIDR